MLRFFACHFSVVGDGRSNACARMSWTPESIRITPLSEVAAQQRMDCDDDLFDGLSSSVEMATFLRGAMPNFFVRT